MEPTFDKTELKMPEEHFGGIATEEHSSHAAFVIGILIVFLMFILAGLYVWGQYLQEVPAPQQTLPVDRPTAEENNEPESNNAEAEVETMSALSTSDEIGAIEADLQGTFVDSLTSEETAVEAELNKNN